MSEKPYKVEVDLSGIVFLALILAVIGGCMMDDYFDRLERLEKVKQGDVEARKELDK